MDKSIIFLILIGVGFAAWIIAFIINKLFVGGGTKNYKTLAEKYELQLEGSKKIGGKEIPLYKGVYRGIPVQFGVTLDGIPGKKTPCTFISAECENKENFRFKIVRRTKANLNKLGEKESPLADYEFDQKFLVNTNNSPEMFLIMNFNNKFRLTQAQDLGANGELSLKDNRIIYIEQGYLKGSTSLIIAEIMLHLICDISDELRKIKPITG